MNTHRLFNWTLAALIGAVLSTSYLLDGPDDIATERASALSMQDALKANRQSVNFSKAARIVCGDYAEWTVNYDDQIVCVTGNAKSSLALNN